MSLLRMGATPVERVRYWYNYTRARVITGLALVAAYVHEFVRHVVILFTITRQVDGLRRDYDKLAQVYGQLAKQHRNVAQVAVETRRRLKHHEAGPLRPSRVILDKRDGERQRKQLAAENGDARDTKPSIPFPGDVIPKGD